MKEAMWGIGLILLGVFGIFLISLFGNITVTNQQDYTALKNTVEAAMYDAIDAGRYRSGFCLCTNKPKGMDGKWSFSSSSQYEITDIENDLCVPKGNYECEKISGEYIIDKKVFAESLVRRFAESVKGNYDYQININDVIEYPPKVSVDIKSTNTYDLDSNEDYSINNHIDAILEMDSGKLSCLDGNIVCYTETKTCLDAITGEYCMDFEETEPPEEKIEDVGCIPDPLKNKVEGNTVCTYDKNGKNCGCYKVSNPWPTPPPNSGPPQKIEPNKTKFTFSKLEIKNGGCFLAGTKVAVKGGFKEIDKLKRGEYVLTYNEEKDINEYKKIVNTFELTDLTEELYTIKTDDTELKITGHHLVYTNRDNKYVYIPAKDLKVGDIVRYSNGEIHKITSISHETIEKIVYNLEIEDNHNFYVGDKAILVHNAAMVDICFTKDCGDKR